MSGLGKTWLVPIREGAVVALVLMGLPVLPANATKPLSCEITAETRARGVVLTGVVQAAQPLRGNFRLVVTSQGGGGSSNVTQGGAFAAAAGVATPLGSVMVNSGAGSRFSASLHIESADGRTCDAKR